MEAKWETWTATPNWPQQGKTLLHLHCQMKSESVSKNTGYKYDLERHYPIYLGFNKKHSTYEGRTTKTSNQMKQLIDASIELKERLDFSEKGFIATIIKMHHQVIKNIFETK